MKEERAKKSSKCVYCVHYEGYYIIADRNKEKP